MEDQLKENNAEISDEEKEVRQTQQKMAANMGFQLPEDLQTEEEKGNSMKWVLGLVIVAAVIAVLKGLFFS